MPGIDLSPNGARTHIDGWNMDGQDERRSRPSSAGGPCPAMTGIAINLTAGAKNTKGNRSLALVYPPTSA